MTVSKCPYYHILTLLLVYNEFVGASSRRRLPVSLLPSSIVHARVLDHEKYTPNDLEFMNVNEETPFIREPSPGIGRKFKRLESKKNDIKNQFLTASEKITRFKYKLREIEALPDSKG